MINDQPVTEMPTHCVRDECRRTASGGKLQSRKGFMVCDECGSSYGAAPAEQPGKAADPRKHSIVKCACGRFDVGIATVQPAWNVEGSTSVRHTQEACGRYGAPAEPSKEQFDKAGRVLAAVMDAERRGENMDPIIARALAAEAAPLREECDRLAEELETAEARLSTARGQAEAFAKTAREARAKVAERDARIVTLTKALEEIRAWAHPGGTFGKIAAAALGAPEGQPRDYDPMTSPVPEGDMNGPHGPLPAPEGQPPVASSEAPPDALRRLAAKWDQEASEAADVNRLATLRLCARELRAALSAPPPPPREQGLLGKEGGDGEAEALLRELGVEASGGRVHVVKHWLAAASAPPWKAPQEDAWIKGWLAGREAAAQEAGVRFGTAAEDALFALPAPSSPEEQLSEVKK